MSTSIRPPEGEKVVDWDEALDRVAGSEETLDELVEIFLEQWPQMMDEIEQGVARADFTLLRRAAHTLKGSAAIFGARRVSHVASSLSQMGKNETLDGSDIALRELQDEMDKLVPELERRL
ncbi:Hpt domain-containing protein [Persicimonas caeni]|uniref:Hpt domain-containing protein n=1 Tax=Persicimonas caeni TaxID=2292766 RepID=A0A4Y6PT04_PERCE|nr:Hpt domain-containing protein [Persicimonas caeni]QDG51269.1 Hpt domain-containing protein [Persicimonas caeni]QED32490.1 Hpt domain-containing protein [Persicimonas caeni]